MLLHKLQSRKQSVPVAALAAQIAAPEVDLEQLTSSQRGVLVVALTAHLGKLKERSVHTNRLRHISEATLMLRLADINADVQLNLQMLHEVQETR